jgi:isopenicillin N synthase-like dioxygenase
MGSHLSSLITDADDPETFARLGESLHTTGFAVLHMSAYATALLDEIFREWPSFFASDAKYQYLSEPGSQEGYFPYLAADAASGRDRKEYFHVRPTGRYPAEVSDKARRLCTEAIQLGRGLLSWLQAQLPEPIAANLSMDLPAMMHGSVGSLLRVQHYLPLGEARQWTFVRAAAHRDANLLTLLPMPTQPGLQVQEAGGQWRDVSRETGIMLVNAGLMLDRATQGYYPAVMHRVVSPEVPHGFPSRVSLPLFLHPHPDAPVDQEVTASMLVRQYVSQSRERGWRPVPGGY